MMMANLQIVPAAAGGGTKNGSHDVEAQYVEMKVPLYSYGCQKKVKKALAHLKGIYSISVDYREQKVTVWGICNKYDVLDSIRSKRKGACFWNPQDNIASIAFAAHDHNLLLPQITSPQSSDSSPNSRPPAASASAAPRPPLITKSLGRSLSNWKTWKKVFIRTHSF